MANHVAPMSDGFGGARRPQCSCANARPWPQEEVGGWGAECSKDIDRRHCLSVSWAVQFGT